MEESLENAKTISNPVQNNQNSVQQKKIAKHICDTVVGRCGGKKNPITKKHIDRYLYTFALEIGCELPNDEMLKNIYFLLLGSEENVGLNCGIEEDNFLTLVDVCLTIYE